MQNSSANGGDVMRFITAKLLVRDLGIDQRLTDWASDPGKSSPLHFRSKFTPALGVTQS